MSVCDVCNVPISRQEATLYTADDFRKIVSKGFQPDESVTAVAEFFGLSHQVAIEQWKNDTVGHASSDWLLCHDCAAKASNYLKEDHTNAFIKFQCQNCGTVYKAKVELAGKKGNCKKCGTSIRT